MIVIFLILHAFPKIMTRPHDVAFRSLNLGSRRFNWLAAWLIGVGSFGWFGWFNGWLVR